MPGQCSRMVSWMTTSGTRWDARYRYFTKGWVNNWGWGDYNGSWGLDYMKECDAQGFVPVVQYYQLFAEPGGGESSSLVMAMTDPPRAFASWTFPVIFSKT